MPDPKAGLNAELVRPALRTPSRLRQSRRSPVLGAVQERNGHRTGVSQRVEHDNSPTTDHDTTHQGHGNDQAGQQHDAQRGTTVLVTELDDGALVVQGRPDGPRAYLNSADAAPLKRELAATFQPTKLRLCTDQDDVR